MSESYYRMRVIVEEVHPKTGFGVQVAEMVAGVSGGRHEFTFNHPIRCHGRQFVGFSLEMHLDQVHRRLVYNEYLANRPSLDFRWNR